MTTTAYDNIQEPQGDIMETVNATTIVRMNDNRLCRYLREKETGRIAMATYYNQDYSEVEVSLWRGRKHAAFSMTDFEYMYSGFAFSDRLMVLGGAVLHGSAIAIDNSGIVFSANSGIGKSTHTSLWKERFGDKVAIINDDKPAIRFYDGIPYICGTPWSGKTDLNTNIKVPLKAIVFIQRATINRIERLNIRDSIFCLTGQMERPYYDIGLGIQTLDRIEKLVANVPVYRLHCSISQEAVEIVYEEIIANRGILA